MDIFWLFYLWECTKMGLQVLLLGYGVVPAQRRGRYLPLWGASKQPCNESSQ